MPPLLPPPPHHLTTTSSPCLLHPHSAATATTATTATSPHPSSTRADSIGAAEAAESLARQGGRAGGRSAAEAAAASAAAAAEEAAAALAAAEARADGAMADGSLEAAAEQQHAERLSVEQLHDIAEAVETMSSDSPLKHEREDLEALEEEKADKRELLEEAKEASILEGGLSTRLLDSRISSMVEKLKAEIADTEGSIGQAFKTLDLDDDGVVSREELMSAMESINFEKRPDAAQFDELVRRLDPDEDGKIAPRLGHRSGSPTHGPRLLLPHTVYLPRSAGKITVKDLHLLVSEIELRDHAKKDDDDDDDDDDAEAPPKAKAKRAAQ